MAMSPSFQRMLIRAKRQEPEAVAYLYIRYLPLISNYIARDVPPAIAEDLTHDVFHKMVNDIHTLRSHDETAFRAWIYAIAYTTVINYYRNQTKIQTVPLDDAYNAVSPDDPTLQVEIVDRITALSDAMKKLNTGERNIVFDRVVLGKNTGTVARRIGKSEPATRKAYSRALQTLRHEINNHPLMRIITIIIVCGMTLVTIIAFINAVGRAEPGTVFYPVKRWVVEQVLPSSDETSHTHKPVPSPTPTPMALSAPTPSPTPTPTPEITPTQSVELSQATPTPTLREQILDTAKNPTSTKSTPAACVLGKCISNPLS